VTRNPTPPESARASSRTSIAGRLRRRAGPQIDYDSLAACLDQLWLQDEAKARGRITALLQQARLDFGTLRVVRPDKRNQAEATQRIGLLVRLMNDSAVSHETIVERRRKLIEIGKEVGLPNLYQRVRGFVEDFGTDVLASPDPEKKLNSILHGPPKKGNREGTGRSPNERLEIAAAVQRLRGLDDKNMTVEEASEKVAESMHLQSGQAVRRVYENERKTEGGKSLVRLVAAGLVKL
jgi:hypothetical protein